MQIRDVLEALSRPERGFLTAEEAAERLSVSVPMVMKWIGRGALGGGEIRGRCMVSAESVDRLLHVREALRAMDEEGNPTPEELVALYSKSRRPAQRLGD